MTLFWHSDCEATLVPKCTKWETNCWATHDNKRLPSVHCCYTAQQWSRVDRKLHGQQRGCRAASKVQNAYLIFEAKYMVLQNTTKKVYSTLVVNDICPKASNCSCIFWVSDCKSNSRCLSKQERDQQTSTLGCFQTGWTVAFTLTSLEISLMSNFQTACCRSPSSARPPIYRPCFVVDRVVLLSYGETIRVPP